MADAMRTEDDSATALRQAQLDQVRLTNEKLKLEVDELRKQQHAHPILAQTIPVVTALVAVAGFLWGVAQYSEQQEKSRETAAREFMKPWLESQREIYMQALSFAATVANSDSPAERKQATDDFWQLYQGKMILVETKSVSGAMVQFGHCLDGSDNCAKNQMNDRSRALATAMAESMAATAKMSFKEFSANQFKYKADDK
ncbi:MAG TPA: hypothetical protein VG759_17470 [Candidatus Angelobacter sp.]|jgi:hypothetical protein|nr:hypothetical protein [Candidatus Angelobacter sp.]